MQQVFPPENGIFKPKRVDKLVRVYTHEGKEEWILLHIEVQAKYKEDFARRMFIYFYRLFDKYQKQISAYAIFTESSLKTRPNTFKINFMNTELSYKFNTFKIADQTDEDLLVSTNPFAIVVMAAKVALAGKNIEDLIDRDNFVKDLKFKLVKHLLSKDFSAKKVRTLMNFIKFYIRFENIDINTKFDNELCILTEKINNMGLEEQIIEIYTSRGVEKGIETANANIIHNLIENMGFSAKQVATMVQLPLSYVKNIIKNKTITAK